MHLLAGPGDVTRHLLLDDAVGAETERPGIGVAGLRFGPSAATSDLLIVIDRLDTL